MLELKNVNKYFNKGKKNELHVINNTSISLNNQGLIALLGPSGCGKTTLLNVIGGLDKIKKGSIYIDSQKISSRWMNKVDRIRNLNIGYIFQDYKLIDSMSVYDNVAIVLKMIGIKDKQEIKTRVEYVLDKVGMLRYQKRPASMLSGGERQRVGIARAIVKDPQIILADEPTGNLDSKNTLEIMNIIKAISRDRLVILVTHEQNLAKFYATRIIEIEDGTIINDYANTHVGELDYEIDNRFYLKDFSNHQKITDQTSDNEFEIYQNDHDSLHLNIVIKNGNIYIQSQDDMKIEVVDKDSSIEFIDDHYQKMNQDQVNAYKFQFQDVIDQKIPQKYSSILNIVTLIKSGFQNVFKFPLLKKILLAGFFLAGMFIMYSASSIAASLDIKEEEFIDINKNYLILNQNQFDVNTYLKYEKREDIAYLLPGTSKIAFSILYNDYYQTNFSTSSLTGSLTDIKQIQPEDLIYGRMPENNYEIIVDKMILTRALKTNDSLKMIGLTKEDKFLNRIAKIPNLNDFKIVGIVDKKNPCFYLNSTMFIPVIANGSANENNFSHWMDMSIQEKNNNNTLLDYNLYLDKIELKKGRLPENDYEIIVNINNSDSMPLNKPITTEVNGTKLTVVGYYSSKFGYQYNLVNQNTIKYNLIQNTKSIIIAPINKAEVLSSFQRQNLNIKDSYEQSKSDYISLKRKQIKSTLFVSGIILLISLIEIFLMIRSSFLSRIKEIGIYRAIGVKKCDIYKMFAGEIIAITTLAGLPGLILMAYILSILSNISYLTPFLMINPLVVGISICCVYLFNLIIGLIPVYNTIKKRPAQILARYDLD